MSTGMKRRFYLISKCLQVKGDYSKCHFRGFYKGVKIKEILLRGQRLNVGEEYILAIDEEKIVEGVLFGKLVKVKVLFI